MKIPQILLKHPPVLYVVVVMAQHVHLVNGLLDKAGFWREVLKQEDPYMKLCLRHCNARPWVAPDGIRKWGRAMEVAWLLSTRIVATLRVTTPHSILVWTMMETLAPQVHDERYIPRLEANALIVRSVYNDSSFQSLVSNYTDANLAQDLHDLSQDPDFERPANDDGVPTTIAIQFSAVANKSAEGAMAILWVLAKRSVNLHTRPAQVLVHTLCALAKQGNATQAFVEKITQGFVTDTGKPLNLDAEGIEACWRLIVHHVDDSNVEAIVSDWLAKLPHEALRLRITLQQIPGEGLTCITSIIKAIQDFPGFNWTWVYKNFPGEMTAAGTASIAITNRGFYGYKKDLSLVKAANFRTVGYIAQQLLVRAGGEGPLRAAKCFTRTPKLKALIDQMIDDFIINAVTIPVNPGDEVPAGIWASIMGYSVPPAPQPVLMAGPQPGGGHGGGQLPPGGPGPGAPPAPPQPQAGPNVQGGNRP
ncbi:hypothetical protein [Wenling crustacean virus 13]|uniref:Uncharacterized protein n=1 Tax=Wenling crustacean virus 13 TaxID=1923482 RepID=A0A1L3KN47_9VIRU|nr:hypothetical protein [Wenling crustacean virus 13]APG78830.1 hypothetical protein [Wenling crustacean virus 13]